MAVYPSDYGCNKCNTGLTSDCNSNNTLLSCSDYCNSCNTRCVSAQNYGAIGATKVSSHADMGDGPSPACVIQNEIIARSWTATYWNSLLTYIDKAENIGNLKTHKSLTSPPAAQLVTGDPCMDSPLPIGTTLISAAKYNNVAQKANTFGVEIVEIPTPSEIKELIRASHALAISEIPSKMYFHASTCDICNTGAQTIGGGCSCNCSCGCNCGCSCSCSCSCGPSCSCPCSDPVP